MFAILALIVRILSNPYSNVLQKKLGIRGLNSLWISFFAYFILSIFCIIPSFGVGWAAFGLDFYKYVILAGVVGAFGNWFLVEAIKSGELSVLGPINSYKSVVSILFAFFLLGETPSLAQFSGIILIIFGSYFIFEAIDEKFSPKLLLRHDIKYRIIALVMTALEAVLIKKIIVMSDVVTSFILWSSMSAFFSFLIILLKGQNFKNDFYISIKGNLKTFLMLAFCMFLMQFSTNIVFKFMPVSSALALFGLSSLVSVFFGWRYFSEKDMLKKSFGAIIMLLGSTVVILF